MDGLKLYKSVIFRTSRSRTDRDRNICRLIGCSTVMSGCQNNWSILNLRVPYDASSNYSIIIIHFDFTINITNSDFRLEPFCLWSVGSLKIGSWTRICSNLLIQTYQYFINFSLFCLVFRVSRFGFLVWGYRQFIL